MSVTGKAAVFLHVGTVPRLRNGPGRGEKQPAQTRRCWIFGSFMLIGVFSLPELRVRKQQPRLQEPSSTDPQNGTAACSCHCSQEPGVHLRYQRASPRVHVCTGVLQVPMAEFGLDGSPSPLNVGDATVPGEEAAGKAQWECGPAEDRLGPGSPITSGCETSVEASNTSLCSDGRAEMPRRSSIIKVGARACVRG